MDSNHRCFFVTDLQSASLATGIYTLIRITKEMLKNNIEFFSLEICLNLADSFSRMRIYFLLIPKYRRRESNPQKFVSKTNIYANSITPAFLLNISQNAGREIWTLKTRILSPIPMPIRLYPRSNVLNRTWTYDQLIKSQLLYQLSYKHIKND